MTDKNEDCLHEYFLNLPTDIAERFCYNGKSFK